MIYLNEHEIDDSKRPSKEIIRQLSPPHCARGPTRCDKCREAAERKEICLLRVYFDHGIAARPMIELEIDGETSFYEYDVLRVFSNENEALDHAKKNLIDDISIS